jgi:transposase
VKKTIMSAADVHEKNISASIAVHRETPVPKDYPYTIKGRQKYVNDLKTLAEKNRADRIVVVYEASSLGYEFYDECRAAGVECHVLAPTRMAKSTQDRKRKSDRWDARKMLELLRGHVLAGNELPSIWVPDDQLRDDRELVRTRIDIGEKKSALKAQVQMLLKRTRARRPAEFKNWTVAYRAWLKTAELPAGTRAALDSLLRQLQQLEEESLQMDAMIVTLSQTPRYRKLVEALQKVKGVGVLAAIVYLTEMGALNRFANRRKVGAYLGLVPNCFESGETSDRKGHITREGPSRLRKILCQSVWSRIRCDEQERVAYDRIVSRNPKHKKIAVVACMRRLGILLWHKGLEAQLAA